LRRAGIPVTEVAAITGFPEIMDGRVKTLHPQIHGGLLARGGIDDAALAAHGIKPIDVVAVNLYPFEATATRTDCTDAEAIENIDVGGPAMLRAAAKNHEHVAVIVDPADIPRLIEARDGPEGRGVQLIMGNRKASRKDTAFRKLQSSVANGVRSSLLGDGTPDTGCGIKLFSREVFMDLPRFDHMHRFLPALFLRHGARVISVPVSHRPRTRGTSKYGMLNRAWVGIIDIFGVRWLRNRYKPGLLVREE